MIDSKKRKEPGFDDDSAAAGGGGGGGGSPPQPKKKKQGRRKIKIEFIEDKSRRQITFSKRKAGIMKKAYELTTLTGTQALLLIASETGHVYTFATPKLQPFVTRQDGKALIQRCLNSPDPAAAVGGIQLPPMDDQSPPQYDDEEESPPPHHSGMGVPPPMMEDPPQQTASIPSSYVESSLVLVVGKVIPVLPGCTTAHLKDLSSVALRWGHHLQQPLLCLAGGCPSSHDIFNSLPNDRVMSDTAIVVGLKVAEVDYTNPNQPSFAIEKLVSYMEYSKCLPDELWHEILAKPYVQNPSVPPPSPEYHYRQDPLNLLQAPISLYVVSTYPNAFVNVVFGVRKQGPNGKGSQVVGISCHTPESHVCKLDIDESTHTGRLQLMSGVDGVPYYHLLPELFK